MKDIRNTAQRLSEEVSLASEMSKLIIIRQFVLSHRKARPSLISSYAERRDERKGTSLVNGCCHVIL